MAAVNVSRLNEAVVLTVQDASYMVPVQTALFSGSRAEALIYALKNALYDESYTIVPASRFTNDPEAAVAVIELLPSGGAGEITAEELALIVKATDNYRQPWDSQAVLTVQDSEVSTTRDLFTGTRKAILVYLLLTVLAGSESFAITQFNSQANYGATLTQLVPTLVTQSQIDLVTIFSG